MLLAKAVFNAQYSCLTLLLGPQADRQAVRQAGRQVGKQAGRQAGNPDAFTTNSMVLNLCVMDHFETW
jgi:hypothetical protein